MDCTHSASGPSLLRRDPKGDRARDVSDSNGSGYDAVYVASFFNERAKKSRDGYGESLT